MRSNFRLYARLAALALIDPLLALPVQLAGLEGRSPASDVLRELFEITQDRWLCQAMG